MTPNIEGDALKEHVGNTVKTSILSKEKDMIETVILPVKENGEKVLNAAPVHDLHNTMVRWADVVKNGRLWKASEYE